MSGLRSTKNSLEFGDAEGADDVKQIQKNSGHIGGNQSANNCLEYDRGKGEKVDQQQTNSLKFPDEKAKDTDDVKQILKNDLHIGGNQSANNSLEFGRAKGKKVHQEQTNSGNIGHIGDYAIAGVPGNKGGIRSTENSLKFGDAIGKKVDQEQTNIGNIGHGGDYAKAGVPINKGGIRSTNRLKFGDAKGTGQVEQIQENDGDIGGYQSTNKRVDFGRAKGNPVKRHHTDHGEIVDGVNSTTPPLKKR